MRKAFSESRPWLFYSVIFGVSYFFTRDLNWPIWLIAIWKAAGVGCLSVYASRCHSSIGGRTVAIMMAFGALGDFLIEFSLEAGALSFMVGHVVAIYYYHLNQREHLAPSQKAFAIIVVPTLVFIAWAMPFDPMGAFLVAFYTLFLAVMVSRAWTSTFPRYRVGLGAMLFAVSDILIFARMGILHNSPIPDYLVWPLYYSGQLLICTGIITSLRHKDPRRAPE